MLCFANIDKARLETTILAANEKSSAGEGEQQRKSNVYYMKI